MSVLALSSEVMADKSLICVYTKIYSYCTAWVLFANTVWSKMKGGYFDFVYSNMMGTSIQ